MNSAYAMWDLHHLAVNMQPLESRPIIHIGSSTLEL